MAEIGSIEEIEGLDLFNGPEHQPFHLERGRPGALLIHGFPGTPAEVRPMAHLLHKAGWSVRAPLLPGFGPDIGSLFDQDHRAWIEAAARAGRELAQIHSPILVIGHSMGGAIALQTACRHKVDGLILLAPFWKLPLDSFWLRLFSPILPLVMPKARPFRNLDFEQQEVRDGIAEFLPQIDLDDPEVRNRIRETAVPTRIFTELRKLGWKARRTAEAVTAPTLILQGFEDELVAPARTRELLLYLSSTVTYQELPAEHNLVRDDAPAWPAVAEAVLGFANNLTAPPSFDIRNS